MRYFYEDIPELHVISAGSLLEFAFGDVKSFPVGRVEYLYLYPLNFREYLGATGKNLLLEELKTVPMRPIAHLGLMQAFHRYAIIGGMPEAIRGDIKQNNLADLPVIYNSIWGTYKKDAEKYSKSETEDVVKNRTAWYYTAIGSGTIRVAHKALIFIKYDHEQGVCRNLLLYKAI